MKTQLSILLFFYFTFLFFSCKKKEDVPDPIPDLPKLESVTTVNGVIGGAKNTLVTINGTNFTSDLSKISVTVNGKICTIQNASATTIVFQIPPYCGRGAIIANINGTIINGPMFEYVYTYTLTSVTNGVTGYLDGQLANSQWNQIQGVCVDTSNNIYVSSYTNPVVRKITADFTTVTTLAGNGVNGNVNAQGTNARLGTNDNISIDVNGTIFYADQSSNSVKKIDRLGNVTTFIQNPVVFPIAACVSKQGNVYVLSESGIAKYSSTGTFVWKVVSHGVGNLDGDSSVVKFNFITWGNPTIDDAEQNLYFANSNQSSATPPCQIKKLNLQTLFTSSVAGSYTIGGAIDGPANTATFNNINGLAIDKFGGMYIAEWGHRIRYLLNGTVTTIVGAAGMGDVDGPAAVGKIRAPNGLAMNKQGDLIISSSGNNKVKRLIID